LLAILLITFPFFSLVLCGYSAARLRMLPLEAIAGLNSFVLFFALPCMLFRFGASTPLADLLDVSLFAVYLFCALCVVAITVLTTRNSAHGGPIGWNDAAFGALVAAFPNTGFMGVPLLVALFGPQSVGPAIVSLTADLVITSSVCIALSRLDGAELHGATQAVGRAFRGMLSNPMPWSILLGAVASAAHFELALPVAKTVGLLADAASPVALFTMGAVLARSQMVASVRPKMGCLSGDGLRIALYKLVLHPLLVLGVGRGVMALGWPLSPFALKIVVLVAALPSASNVSMLTERFGADTGRVARIIMISTAAAFLSFAAAVAWLT
jgi:predicted permease